MFLDSSASCRYPLSSEIAGEPYFTMLILFCGGVVGISLSALGTGAKRLLP